MRRLLPLRIKGAVTIGRGLASETWPPVLTLMVPPPAALASSIAWRREPRPVSLALLTVKAPAAGAVGAAAATAAATSSAGVTRRWTHLRIGPLLSREHRAYRGQPG